MSNLLLVRTLCDRRIMFLKELSKMYEMTKKLGKRCVFLS